MRESKSLRFPKLTRILNETLRRNIRSEESLLLEGEDQCFASSHEDHYSKRADFKKLLIPEALLGHVIGKGHQNLNTIETKNGVTLKVCNSKLYIKAESEESEKLAVREIKSLAKNSSGFGNTDGLKEEMLKVLETIYAEKSDKEVKADMWCHFGHAYITKVDEDEVDDTYTLNEVKEKIQTGNSKSWKPFFKGGVEEMDVKEITSLPSRATQEDIRYDFGFYTPSCRNVRVKAWIMEENSGQEGSEAGSSMTFCTTAPVPVKNILTQVKSNEEGAASNTPKFYICSQPHHRMKVDILMPTKGLDCRLLIRTLKNYVPKTPQDEEEDKILESYLMGMKIDGDRLTLPPASQLQEGFDLYYHRRSLRKIYQYEMEGEQFSLKVCKEQATNVDPCGFDRINVDEIPEKIDIHLHCDEWDRALEEGNWEPQHIAAKLCNFLQFVRYVQQSVSPKAIR
ncbi:hypothetical protein P5673_019474 [Acropora cervicornis]|uniref:K Homology domain-containing protein n=1 Tax=Acropora cervicornis TaxID=6130 RepID=A0AAD9QBN8_ACRCE|nr:hypothetical protein P5673_019474 [Acropora cervicornis]